MSVSNYTPSESGCTYNYSKLKEVVYLVSASHVKDVHIDNGEAYIDGLTELPLRINGFNIQFTEESSLDERYRFQKKLTLSLTGYVNINFFGERYYAIIEAFDGTFYMVNVDFPAKVTHTFNLGQNTNQTDFTFASTSNFPTLRLASQFEAVEPPCIGYNVYGIDSLKLIEKNYVRLDTVGKKVYTYGDVFKSIKYLGNSCTLQETYDGETVTDTITFDIGFDNYKTSWHYNLLEFLQNTYAALISPKGNDNEYFIGFNYGLQPSFSINTSTEVGQTDIITVTLTEQSVRGLLAANDYSEEQKTATRWRYIKQLGNIKCYECLELGKAQFLVQQEVDGLGNPTNNYKVLEGYAHLFPNLNIVATFNTIEQFDAAECASPDGCSLDTTMPNVIQFTSVSCNTYPLSATCDWNINSLPTYITAEPMSGQANVAYNVTICNTQTPTSTQVEDDFHIAYGNSLRVVTTKVQTNDGFVVPTHQYIDCNQQVVNFSFNADCPINVTGIDSPLTYSIGQSSLSVSVPMNSSTSGQNVYYIIVNDCNNNSQTLYITQDHVYEKWVETDEYMCVNGNSYKRLQQYTGTTSSNINTPTGVVRAGDLITADDSRCSTTTTKFEFDGNYYCYDGNKYKIEEEFVSYDGGTTWTKTGVTRIGEMVESASTFCESAVTYSWVLTDRYQCGEDEIVYDYRWVTVDGQYVCNGFDKYNKEKKQQSSDGGTTWTDVTPSETRQGSTLIESNSTDCGYSTFKYKITYNDSSVSSGVCTSSSTLSYAETKQVTPLSSMTSAEVGTCVTTIGSNAFSDCVNLASITLPSTVKTIQYNAFQYASGLTSVSLNYVTTIGEWAFSNARALSAVTINSNCTSIGDSAFEYCINLTSFTLPTTYNFRTISEKMLYNCSGLTEVEIPSNVTSIGTQAFYGCTSLQRIRAKSTQPATLGDYVFANTNDCPIIVPRTAVDLYKTRWSAYSSRIQADS